MILFNIAHVQRCVTNLRVAQHTNESIRWPSVVDSQDNDIPKNVDYVDATKQQT